MSYAVRLEQFEGPLELLLQLIEKEKLDITRVSLSVVADQYLEYLAYQGNVPLAHLSHFLSIASRLLLIKSRALLPLLEFTEEEERSIEDLEWQLREYARFRDASLVLGKMFELKGSSVGRENVLNKEVVFLPPKDITAERLGEVFAEVLGEIPLFQKLEEEELRAVISLEEKMLEWRATLSDRVESSFRQMTAQVTEKIEIIIAFLALLELVKQRHIHADQETTFSDIALKHNLPAA